MFDKTNKSLLCPLNVDPDMDPNCSDSVPERILIKKLIFNLKVSRRQQKHEKLPIMQRVPYIVYDYKGLTGSGLYLNRLK